MNKLGKERRINTKIHHPFLIESIKEQLQAIPVNLNEKIIFEDQNYRKMIGEIFDKLIYIPPEHFNVYLTDTDIQKVMKK